MPTITTPDGRRIPIPEGASDDDIDRLIEDDAYYNNPDWPKKGEGEPSVQSQMADTLEMPPSELEPDPFAQEEESIPDWAIQADKLSAPEEQAERLAGRREAEAEALPWYQQGAIGLGQSLDSTMRGAGQLGTYLLHGEDSPQYKAALEKEKEARIIDEAILGTGAGRAGQVLGHVGQALVPAAGAAKIASLGGKGLTLGKLALAEGAVGAAMGANEPLVEGESRGKNAAWGGGLSAVGAAPLKAVGSVVKAVAPGKTQALINVGQGIVRKLGGDEGARAVVEANREVVGPLIGQLTDTLQIPRRNMAAYVKQNADLPPKVRDKIRRMRAVALNTRSAPLKGAEVQEMREDIGEMILNLEAAKKAGLGTSETALELKALQRLRRQIDKGVEASVDPAISAELKRLHTHYRKGTKPRTLEDDLRSGLLPAILSGGERSNVIPDYLFGGTEYEE